MLIFMQLYPFFFQPRLVSKMWGGRQLGDLLSKTLPDARPYGESWEVFDFPPGTVGADGRSKDDVPGDWVSAKLTNGPYAGKSLHELMSSFGTEILGDSHAVETKSGPQFPLLVKFLDAGQDLSVQVHPDDAYAKTHAEAFVKNECWHVLAREPGARLLIGLKQGVTPDAFRASLDDGTCEAQLNAVLVEVGQTYYLPSGTVHALGAGVLAAEVQTPSDTTYRVHDFNRVEPATGKKRSLHVEEAMACIDFNSTEAKSPVEVVRAPQFEMRTVHMKGDSIIDTTNRATVVVCVRGFAKIAGQQINRGGTLVIPASLRKSNCVGEATLLIAHAS